MFKSEGNFNVVITDALIATPRFPKENGDPNAFDLCIVGQTEDGQSGTWRGEISQNLGTGNAANRTQAEMTMAALAKIGYQGNELDLINESAANGGHLPCFVNVTTVFGVVKTTSKDGKDYYNVRYLGGSAQDEPAPLEFISQLAAAYGGQPAQPATPAPTTGFAQRPAAPASGSGVAPVNPFRK